MRIETSRFIMEELHPEDDVQAFAQISKKMAWKDTIEILLNERKFEEYIKNIAMRDMELALSARINGSTSHLVRGQSAKFQVNLKKQQNIFKSLYQNQKYKQYLEQARIKASKYRSQIIAECKKLNIDFEKDDKIFEKIKNENLQPPIPISDWHYNIQFLKPNLQDKSNDDTLWEEPVGKYIRDGIKANNEKDRSLFYFKIIDKQTNQIVGIARICSKPKEFIVNYDKDNNPVMQVCVGDPGLFLDPSCQGSCKGSEIYATTLNVLYNFLLKEEDKKQKAIIKCNKLNSASRRLQYSIGADITNETRPIDNRYYFMVSREKILQSKCLKKLASMGLDTYSISIDGTCYRVSLSDGILKEQKSSFGFLLSINKMKDKVKEARLGERPMQTTIQLSSQMVARKSIDNYRKIT